MTPHAEAPRRLPPGGQLRGDAHLLTVNPLFAVERKTRAFTRWSHDLAIDASLIEADANKQNSTPKDDWDAARIDPADAPRAVREYLDTLDEAAFGAASEVQPKFTSHSDPASQWTAARKGPAFFSYSDNYLIDTDHGVIVDVEATRSIRQAEVGSTETMLKRVKEKFDLHPERLIADTA